MTARQVIAAAGLVCVLAAAALFAPYDARDLEPDGNAIAFTDRNDLPLGTVLGSDERHAIAVPLERMSPAFVNAILAAEDARFFSHQSIDGRALLRSFAHAAIERTTPHGGSTIAMQLARLIHPVPAGLFGKAREVIDAQRLENSFGRRAVLEAYANRVPMGSNLYGVEAAARTYFHAPASELDIAQGSLLAAIPNDPPALDPYRHWSALKARQHYVLARMVATGAITADQAQRAFSEHLALAPRGGGILASAHYIFERAHDIGAGQAVVRTTIDRPLQTFVEAQMRDVVRGLAAHNVRDAAAIVIDNRTGETLAYAGSPDYFDTDILGRNDGVQALRQPGSTLKPFLYALALERSAIAPASILDDEPVAYGLPGGRLYEPADYSGRYLGPVRVRLALANSLNVPAVRLIERVGVDAFLARLHELGFTHLTKDASFYGLGLALGGGEVSLDELAHAYARLARGTSAADLIVTDMLADPHARAAAFGVDSIVALPFAAAVKTGTSSGQRDTWTVGFSRDYTVGTWVGNFDGSAMQHVSGITGAAPLWARIMLHLHERREPLAFEPPPGYRRRALCAATGGEPTRACRSVVMEFVAASARPAAAKPAAVEPIVFPADGDRFVYNGSPERLRLRFGMPPREVRVDSVAIAPIDGAYVWTVRSGEHTVRVVTVNGEAVSRFTVGPPLRPLHHGFTVAARAAP
jgi:penicillin-binding protein 1C